MSNEELCIKIQLKEQDTKDFYSQLCTQNIGLINSSIKKYLGYEEYEDLIQEAYLSLIESANTFNKDTNIKFYTYASNNINWHLYRTLNTKGANLVKLPAYIIDKIKEYDKINNTFQVEYGRLPTDEELILRLNISKDNYLSLIEAINTRNIKSLNDSFDDEESELISCIPDSINNIDDYMTELFNDELYSQIWELVDSLKSNYSGLLKMRYKDNKDIKTISQELNCNANTVQSNILYAKYELKKIIRKPENKELYNSIWDYSSAYKRTGLTAYRKDYTSSVEREVLRKEYYTNKKS